MRGRTIARLLRLLMAGASSRIRISSRWLGTAGRRRGFRRPASVAGERRFECLSRISALSESGGIVQKNEPLAHRPDGFEVADGVRGARVVATEEPVEFRPPREN